MRVLPRLHSVAKFIHLQHWQHLHATLGKMCDSGDPIHLIRPIQWLPHHYGHVYTLKGGGTMEQISIETPNPKCRLYWCAIEFIDWRYSHVGIFDPSCELAPL